jgi:hypothetical protein
MIDNKTNQQAMRDQHQGSYIQWTIISTSHTIQTPPSQAFWWSQSWWVLTKHGRLYLCFKTSFANSIIANPWADDSLISRSLKWVFWKAHVYCGWFHRILVDPFTIEQSVILHMHHPVSDSWENISLMNFARWGCYNKSIWQWPVLMKLAAAAAKEQ